MVTVTEAPDYRRDVDGLRALAVLAVLLFHLGYLPAGYLGVDVFFVISGYLITGIIVRHVESGRFSLRDFYLRRVRRILPLSVFITHVALWVGVAVMLPNDLENLAQSVVATNVFANNILQAITTRNYWDVVNEYKPLMHTWSLGVEEQFYLAYPVIVALGARRGPRVLFAALSLPLTASLGMTLFASTGAADKFYWLTYRFWELAAGGVLATLLRNRTIVFPGASAAVAVLAAGLVVDVRPWIGQLVLPAVVLSSLGVLAIGHHRTLVSCVLLENPIMVGIGRISFSIYMWHQVLLAFARYCYWTGMTPLRAVVVAVATIVLSVMTYVLIEQPFRDPKRIRTRTVLLMVGLGLAISTPAALFVYQQAGVLRDVPELDLVAGSVERGFHSRYNARNHAFDRTWPSSDKIRVLVVGNSFARDFINILRESRFADAIDISYVKRLDEHPQAKERVESADLVFLSTPDDDALIKFDLPLEKTWIVGTKNFGVNNGLFYNHPGVGYFDQRTPLQKGQHELNEHMRRHWGNRYIDLIAPLQDRGGRVPVFTPDHKFISQDCRHLTRPGARYYATILDGQLAEILGIETSRQTGP